MHHGANVHVVKLHPGTAFEPTRQDHGPVADANQPTDSMAHRLEHATHFTVSAFRNRDPIPAICTFATAVFNRPELRETIVKFDAIQQFLFFFPAEVAQHPHGVFALKPKAGVHQVIGQLTRVGEQQQPLGIQVQPADRLPLSQVQFWQAPEHGRPVLRVIVRHHFTHGLVISDHAGGRGLDPEADGLAIDLDLVAKLNALTNVGRLVVHRDAPLHDELLHLKARSQASLRQHFMQFGGFGHGSQHALAQQHLGNILIRIKLS